MAILTQKSHVIKTKFHAVTTYRQSNFSVYHVCLKYHISKAWLMRWNKAFDGNIDSLRDKSRRPHSPHPKAHTPLEITKIQNMIKRNPHIGLTELYSKLRSQTNYYRHYCSLYRVLRRIGYYANQANVRKKYRPKKYHTPKFLDEKMQLDLKFVPMDYNANLRDDYRYYQYTLSLMKLPGIDFFTLTMNILLLALWIF
jgi:hypothetical protein